MSTIINANKRMKSFKLGIGIIFIIAISYILSISFNNLWQPDETRYAEISREMLVSRDWINPKFLGLRYFEKPSIGYWINNLSQWLFGHTNFAVHFGSTISISLITLTLYWLTVLLWNDKSLALTTAIIYSSCLLVYSIGTYAVLDPMFSLWITIAMYVFWKAAHLPKGWSKGLGYIILGIICGLGFMTKGFLALAIPFLSILPWTILQKRCQEIFLYGFLSIFGAIIISLPWIIAIANREPDFWYYFIWTEHFHRFASNTAQHKAPFWYYFPLLIAGTLPWTGLLPASLYHPWLQRKKQNEGFYLLSWVSMPLLLFSLSKGKLPTYILPCFSPLALLIAHYTTIANKVVLKINGFINLLFGLSCILVLATMLTPWNLFQNIIFSPNEKYKLLLGISGFVIWAVLGSLTVWKTSTWWYLAALCPLGIEILIGQSIPDKIIHAKQPQSFIRTVQPYLEKCQFIFSNNVGIAATLAWELKRSDISLFEHRGELAYGLSYADSYNRFICKENFSQWLHAHSKKNCSTALVLLLEEENESISFVLHPDQIYQSGRLVLLIYH
nr:lipid IV(A) 4-amino-4-deoxy-L-arabinosyltransferase [secondary endosymbiont of Heteropsylla cubana]